MLMIVATPQRVASPLAWHWLQQLHQASASHMAYQPSMLSTRIEETPVGGFPRQLVHSLTT
eukprot:4003498-Amphidinium_carterae.1